MGWLRLEGSLKFYVSFAIEPYKRDYIHHTYIVKLHTPQVSLSQSFPCFAAAAAAAFAAAVWVKFDIRN